MKVLAIIAEYNPFHNGHLYHIQQSKKITESTHTIALMSGNFVQRGDCAIIDKFSRAKSAVLNGVDLVLELPYIYAAQSAHDFADGAIYMLSRTGIVDMISFGSESGNLSSLWNTASNIFQMNSELKTALDRFACTGLSFPHALQAAYRFVHGTSISEQSNDILAMEYLMAMMKYRVNFSAVTIKRESSLYHDPHIINHMPSATAVRNLFLEQDPLPPYEYTGIPRSMYEVLKSKQNDRSLMCIDRFFHDIKTIILRDRFGLDGIYGIKEGLENRIYQHTLNCDSLESLKRSLKTKRYPYSTLSRIMVNILCNVKKTDMDTARNSSLTPACRILAFNDKGRELLRKIDPKQFVLINKAAHFVPDTTQQAAQWQIEQRAGTIYYSRYREARTSDINISPIYVKNHEPDV